MGSAIVNKMIESGIVQKAMPNPQLQDNPNFEDLGKYAVDKSQNILSNIFSGSGVANPQTQPQPQPQPQQRPNNFFGVAHSMSDFVNNFMRNHFSQPQSPNNQMGNGIESLFNRGPFSQKSEAFKPFGGLGQNDFIKNLLANRGFASGGYVNTNLTTTVPPDRGPNPQGIQTLLERRYN